MHVLNLTKKTMVAKNAAFCKNIFSRSLGLMFSLKPRSLVFLFEREKIIPLHMLFVFFPIDVLFLDKNKTVVEKKENLKPFAFYTPKSKAKYIIEVRNGKIKEAKTQLGDRLSFGKTK